MCDGIGEFMLVRGQNSLEPQQRATRLHNVAFILHLKLG
jgi:hypothetical protein